MEVIIQIAVIIFSYMLVGTLCLFVGCSFNMSSRNTLEEENKRLQKENDELKEENERLNNILDQVGV